MANELVSAKSGVLTTAGDALGLPSLIVRAGGGAERRARGDKGAGPQPRHGAGALDSAGAGAADARRLRALALAGPGEA